MSDPTCEYNWGSHGCELPTEHDGDHECIGEHGCGDKVGQDGRDASGFKWDLWGPDCRVYWGHSGCSLVRGHRERDGTDHVDESGNGPTGSLLGEDAGDRTESEAA